MSLHRFLLTAIITMVIAGAAIVITFVWEPDLISNAFLSKTLITLGILTVLSGLILVLKSDLAENKKLKDENYID